MRVLAVAALALVFAMPAKAQLTDNGYANIDWQFNFPLSNHFADKASGWGMSFEGGYYVTPNIALGAFLAYHSNHEYFGRQTLPVGEGGSINTDQQHTLFQLPFGLAGRYITLLDIGTGTGYFSNAMKERGWRVKAIEKRWRNTRMQRNQDNFYYF